MHLNRLGLALATSRDAPAAERFALGTLVGQSADAPTHSDDALSLLEAFAYIGDALSSKQEQVADEALLETAHRDDGSVILMRFPNDLRPSVIVIADDVHVFIVVIGSEAGDSTVRFGEGEQGRRPPAGLEHATATYRHGGGKVGEVELRELPLRQPFRVIVAHHPGTQRQRLTCSVIH
jgi:hypothetical protein